jgi:hypothetical protein
MKTLKTWAAAAAMVALSGAAYAAPVFQGRLADGTASDTCTVSGPTKCTMFYNTTLDITILNDWGIGAGTWSATAAAGSAQALAESAGFAATGLSGWVLPTGDGDAPAGTQNQYLSIMNDVGGSVWQLQDQFDNVQYSDLYYWSSTEYTWASDEDGLLNDVWFFNGNQGPMPTYFSFWAVAVRPGDVAAAASTVPVPAAAWLFGSGLLGLVGVARKRRR